MSPEEIRSIRKGLAMTQEQFAAALQISAKYVSDIECGKKSPSADRIDKIRSLKKPALPLCHTGWWYVEADDIEVPGCLDYAVSPKRWEGLVFLLHEGDFAKAVGIDYLTTRVEIESQLREGSTHALSRYSIVTTWKQAYGVIHLKYENDHTWSGFYLARDTGQETRLGIVFGQIKMTRKLSEEDRYAIFDHWSAMKKEFDVKREAYEESYQKHRPVKLIAGSSVLSSQPQE